MTSNMPLRVSAMLPVASAGLCVGFCDTAVQVLISLPVGMTKHALSTCMVGARASASQARFCSALLFSVAFPANKSGISLAYSLP